MVPSETGRKTGHEFVGGVTLKDFTLLELKLQTNTYGIYDKNAQTFPTPVHIP